MPLLPVIAERILTADKDCISALDRFDVAEHFIETIIAHLIVLLPIISVCIGAIDADLICDVAFDDTSLYNDHRFIILVIVLEDLTILDHAAVP